MDLTYEPNNISISKSSQRLIDSIESRQRISGCLFGFVGSIVLAFAIYLIHAGKSSSRSEEVVRYLNSVMDWKDNYQEQF